MTNSKRRSSKRSKGNLAGSHVVQLAVQRDLTAANDRTRLLAVLRTAPHLWLIVLVAIIGCVIALYLTAEHYQAAPLVCSATGVVDCAPVLQSAYSVIPGTSVPITLPGIGWFLVSAGLATFSLRSLWSRTAEPGWLKPAQILWGALGVAVVFGLVYAEFNRIHHICLWCTVVHILIVITLLAFVNRPQQT